MYPVGGDPSGRGSFMSEALQGVPDLSGEAYLQLERLLQRFESAWRQGSRPTIEDYLPPEPAQRTAVLIELVATDLEYRLRAGERARVEDYLGRYADLQSNGRLLLELIAAEFDLRRESEPDLAPDEYLRRFPQVASDLPAHLGDLSSSSRRRKARPNDTPLPRIDLAPAST